MSKGNLSNNSKENIYIFTGGILTEKVFHSIDLDKGIIIGVDKGASWLLDHKIVSDYFVGDFDSIDEATYQRIKTHYSSKIHQSPAEKDETDTELGVRLAISLGAKKIVILGGIGSRLDHVLANIHVLLQAERKNISATILGDSNRIQLLLPNKEITIEKSKFTYISLIPFTEKVEGISLTGFKYSLDHAEMEIGVPFGISNELIEEKGTISIETGILLIIESKD